MTRKQKRRPIADRFWAKVDKSGECWIWTAETVGDGYGPFWINDGKKLATHVSWMLEYGEYPDGGRLCHTCDTPSCVNPAHLFLGTQDANMQDMARKGRSRRALSDDQVREVRARYAAGESAEAIAVTMPIGQTNISALLRGETYRYVS